MRRLTLLFLVIFVVVASASSSRAQQPGGAVIGFLSTASEGSRTSEQLKAFYERLREAGFTEGQNVTIEYRWANNNYARLPALAKELTDLRVAVIVAAGGHVAALAAHGATKQIPIVFTTVTDPVKDGLVASFNRPGGNATGTAGLTSELDPKRLELLHEINPAARVIGVLVNTNRPGVDRQIRDIQVAADKLKLKIDVRKTASETEIESAFAALHAEQIEGLIVTADPLFNNLRTKVVALAAKYRMPAIYQWREFVSAGGLMSYGPSITEAYQHAGFNAGRILKGAKPADIPVVQPTKFQLVINRAAAKRLGLTVPDTLIALANEVIE